MANDHAAKELVEARDVLADFCKEMGMGPPGSSTLTELISILVEVSRRNAAEAGELEKLFMDAHRVMDEAGIVGNFLKDTPTVGLGIVGRVTRLCELAKRK